RGGPGGGPGAGTGGARPGPAPPRDDPGGGPAVPQFPGVGSKVRPVRVRRRANERPSVKIRVEEEDIDEGLSMAEREARPLNEAAVQHHGHRALVLILDVDAFKRPPRAVRRLGAAVEHEVLTRA